jgi:hypothetical protein
MMENVNDDLSECYFIAGVMGYYTLTGCVIIFYVANACLKTYEGYYLLLAEKSYLNSSGNDLYRIFIHYPLSSSFLQLLP